MFFRCMVPFVVLTGTSQMLWRWLLIHGLILRWSFSDQTPRWVYVSLENWIHFRFHKCLCEKWWLSFVLTLQSKKALEVTYYSKDEEILRKMLTEENVIDWSTYFMIGGEFWAKKVVWWLLLDMMHFLKTVYVLCNSNASQMIFIQRLIPTETVFLSGVLPLFSFDHILFKLFNAVMVSFCSVVVLFVQWGMWIHPPLCATPCKGN